MVMMLDKNTMKIDFKELNSLALPYLPQILDRRSVAYKPKRGHVEMLNPKRSDRHFGSFSINTRSGVWKDFATGDGGGDVISLIAFLDGCNQFEAAKGLIQAMGISHG